MVCMYYQHLLAPDPKQSQLIDYSQLVCVQEGHNILCKNVLNIADFIKFLDFILLY